MFKTNSFENELKQSFASTLDKSTKNKDLRKIALLNAINDINEACEILEEFGFYNQSEFLTRVLEKFAAKANVKENPNPDDLKKHGVSEDDLILLFDPIFKDNNFTQYLALKLKIINALRAIGYSEDYIKEYVGKAHYMEKQKFILPRHKVFTILTNIGITPEKASNFLTLHFYQQKHLNKDDVIKALHNPETLELGIDLSSKQIEEFDRLSVGAIPSKLVSDTKGTLSNLEDLGISKDKLTTLKPKEDGVEIGFKSLLDPDKKASLYQSRYTKPFSSANSIAMDLYSFANKQNNDKYTQNLTSEKMIQNLKNNGTVFDYNADDGKVEIDDLLTSSSDKLENQDLHEETFEDEIEE